MLHPVGPLPAAVYWRRRLTLLAVLLAVLALLAWLVVVLAQEDAGTGTTPTAATEPGELPALERVVPSVAQVRSPSTERVTAPPPPPPPEVPAGPTPGGPCTGDELRLEVRTPGRAAVGDKPTFELAVTNTSTVPCVRALDKQLQELVMVDAAGARVWGSNDCFPESSDDQRTLAPGETVVFPVVWGGLTSEPGCAAARVTPPPGSYLLRGRLDTLVSGDAPLTIG